MGYGQDTFRRNSRNRRGLSFVEFTGCLLALGSGVALGSAYLGVDMKTLFVAILERAELVEPGFFAAEAAAEEAFAIIPEEADKTAAESSAEIFDIAPSRSGVQLPVEKFGDATQKELKRELTEEGRQAATKLYWHGLTACIREEVSDRSLVSGDPSNWQLFDYLTLRREGHQKAVEAIESLGRRGVDERLLWHGDQVLTWNKAGAKLFGRAVDLLTDAPSDQLTGPIAQSWQSAATQHRMEERLVRDKHFSVASYLDHAFKDAAPFKPAF